jgi:hypothetical protein
MDRQILERDLVKAEGRVREGERHITNQRAVVDRLEADGSDAATARHLLATFMELQATHQADRDRLAREIEMEEKMIWQSRGRRVTRSCAAAAPQLRR